MRNHVSGIFMLMPEPRSAISIKKKRHHTKHNNNRSIIGIANVLSLQFFNYDVRVSDKYLCGNRE